MPSWKRIRPLACRWSNLIKKLSAAEPDAPRPTSEGLFGYRRDHGILRADCDAGAACEFYAELRHYMRQAVERPESFPIRERDLRRVNLQRFPYHFLFR